MVGTVIRRVVVTGWVVCVAATLASAGSASAGGVSRVQVGSAAGQNRSSDTIVDARSGLTISVTNGDHGKVIVKANGHGLDVRKTVAGDGAFSFTINGVGDVLSVAGLAGGVVVTRGQQTVRIDAARPEPDAFARAAGLVAGSPALRLFRGAISRLGPDARESVGGRALEIADVLLRVVQDDPGAVGRLHDRGQSAGGMTVRVGLMRRPCFAEWEAEVLAAWGSYESCYNDFSWWSGGREVCALVFILRAEVAWFQLWSCAGFSFTVP